MPARSSAGAWRGPSSASREAGKSTLLATLAARRLPVLADDLVVTDGYQAFCGPRTIDLRQPLPGTTGPLTSARAASRWRLSLPPLPVAVPLGGWIYLRWHTEVAMAAVPASDLVARLAARRSWSGLPSDPADPAGPGQPGPAGTSCARLTGACMDQAVDLMLCTLPSVPWP